LGEDKLNTLASAAPMGRGANLIESMGSSNSVAIFDVINAFIVY
jgi:hypothetical protein